MDFLKEFKKDLKKAGLEEGASLPPRYWFSTGNYVLNRLLSGSFMRGFPQGRITCFTGPSFSGKSFMLCNAMREAQKDNAHLVVLDSENALDDDFVTKLGIDTSQNYTYIPVNTSPEVQKTISSFINGYKEEYKDDLENAPRVVFAIDSLDMLMTETELENFEKGITKGDQGQRNKQFKALLRQLVQAIKKLNISIVLTAQVYKNQDLLNGEGVWIVSDAIKYSISQIALLTKLKLKQGEGKDKVAVGMKMKVEGYKTRFTKPFQTATIEVPYETGMDPYTGLLDVAIELGIVEKDGKGYIITGTTDKWSKDEFSNVAADVLVKCEAAREKFLEATLDDLEEDTSEKQPTAKSKREKKHKKEE